MTVPGGPVHLARILASALEDGATEANDRLARFLPDVVGTAEQTVSGNGVFRVTYIDNTLLRADKRRSFAVTVREVS